MLILGKGDEALRNFLARLVKIMVDRKIAQVCVANLITQMLAPNVTDTPEDAWVPPKMKRKDEYDAWMGVDIMPIIIKTSMLPNDDGRVRVPELTPKQTKKLFKKFDLCGIKELSAEDPGGGNSTD